MIKIIANCRLYDKPNERLHIIIENDKIKQITPFLPKEGSLIFDAKETLVAPGLIDTHVHGAGGYNPSDNSPKAIDKMAESLCKMGTTSFTPTAFYNVGEENEHLQSMADHLSENCQADNLGLHLEGPFINPLRKGGIPRTCLCEANRENFSDLLIKTRSRLKILTIAPEITWTEQVISMSKELGFISSLGHSDADPIFAQKGLDEGISCITHLNNAMRKYNRDKNHPLETLAKSNVYAQIIPDGVHLKEDEIRHLYNLFGLDRLICITDGIAACGLPDGEYDFNGKRYQSENGLAFYSDGSGMIGTTLSLFQVMMRFKNFSSCTLSQALKTVTENPAKCLGVDKRKGFIREGYDADLIFIKNDELVQVINRGQLI